MSDLIDLSHWPALLVATIAVFAGSVVQGSTGLGLGLVAAPILLLINPIFVPGPLLVLALVISSLMTTREWRSIDRRGLGIALCGRVPGTIFAGVTISLIPNSIFGLIFGGLVLIAVLSNLSGWRAALTSRNLLTAGFASGYMGTLTSIGAPPIALVYASSDPTKSRSTMAAFFVVGSAFSLLTLVYFGRFSTEQMIASAIFLPPLFFGFWASSYAVRYIDQRIARLAVLLLSGVSAIVLIGKSLMSG